MWPLDGMCQFGLPIQIKSLFTLVAISLHVNRKMAITWPF